MIEVYYMLGVGIGILIGIVLHAVYLQYKKYKKRK